VIGRGLVCTAARVTPANRRTSDGSTTSVSTATAGTSPVAVVRIDAGFNRAELQY
jgi:hypothetical protein